MACHCRMRSRRTSTPRSNRAFPALMARPPSALGLGVGGTWMPSVASPIASRSFAAFVMSSGLIRRSVDIFSLSSRAVVAVFGKAITWCESLSSSGWSLGNSRGSARILLDVLFGIYRLGARSRRRRGAPLGLGRLRLRRPDLHPSQSVQAPHGQGTCRHRPRPRARHRELRRSVSQR